MDGFVDLALIADGRHVVTGSEGDHTLRVWDTETGECLGVILMRGHSSLAFQSRTGRLIGGFSDGRVEFYSITNLPLGPFITTARREIVSEDLPTGPVTARPPCCGQLITMPVPVSERIKHWTLAGGAGGYTDPALLLSCPNCQTPLRMNPFFVNLKSAKA